MQPAVYQARVRQRFQDAAAGYPRYSQPQQEARAYLLRQLPASLPSGGMMVDAGCGDGAAAPALRQRYPEHSLITLDHAEAMRPMVVADIARLPLPPACAALVVCHLALHWLVNPAVGIKSLWQCVAPGGWLALSVPSRGIFPEWQKLLHQAGIMPPQQYLPDCTDLLEYVPDTATRHFSTWQRPYPFADWSAFFQHLKQTGTNTPRLEALPAERRALRQVLRRCAQATGGIHVTYSVDVAVLQKR